MTIRVFGTAHEGIVAEEELLARPAPGILVWRAALPALSVPRAVARRYGISASDAHVVGRGSGGGVVPQGPSTTNLAMVVPVTAGFTIDTGYRLICGIVGRALEGLGLTWSTGPVAGAFCDGANNITVEGRKLAGTAQRWRHGGSGYVALLHAALVIKMPTAPVWEDLAGFHDAMGGPTLRREVHVALADLTGTARREDIDARLFEASRARLADLRTVAERAA